MNTLFDIDHDQPAITASAIISECGLYRYRLVREWDATKRHVAFCMLNPSTADASVDDPTVTRCVRYAQRWECGGIEVVNLFALRATNPRDLMTHPAPIGPDNDIHIRSVAEQCSAVILAWGTDGKLFGRDKAVLGILRKVCAVPWCLKLSKDGHPCHPLYLKADLQPQVFKEGRVRQ